MTQDINSIDTVEKVSIGGVDQWISIKGEDLSNPVVLVLHGGPGGTEMPIVNAVNRNLQSIFTVVNWDQRGAGKSFSKHVPKESLNVAQFMADTHEIVEYLKKRLDKEKLFILGHSWGTYLGLTEVYNHPENIYAYIGMGQMVNGIMSEQTGYNFALETAKKKNDQAALKKLLGKGEFRDGSYVNGRKGCIAQRDVLKKYGAVIYDKKVSSMLTKTFLKSHDYTFINKINWIRGQLVTLKIMSIDWAFEVDFLNKVKKVEIPVCFLAGRHDYTTPFELVEKYCETIEAPSKELVFFENSAHNPMFEEPQEFFKAMSRIKEQAMNSAVKK
jgi:pimeloyl-ACP methyl ester carboxylesterase